MLGPTDYAEFTRGDVVMLLEAVEAYWRTPQCDKQAFLPLRQTLHGFVFGEPQLTTYVTFTIVLDDDAPLRRYTKLDFPTRESAKQTCQLWSHEMDTDGLAVAGVRADGTLVRLP